MSDNTKIDPEQTTALENNTSNPAPSQETPPTEEKKPNALQRGLGKIFDPAKKANQQYLKPAFDKVAPIAEAEWLLFKGAVADGWKNDTKPAISDAYYNIAKPILKTTLDVTFQELGYMSSAVRDGYKGYVVPGLKAAYGDTLKPVINAGAKPAEWLMPQTTAKIKDKLENGVTDPVQTASTVAAYGAAAGVLSYKAVIWTAEAFFAVLKAPYTGYRKFREWDPENPAVNKVKNVVDKPFDVLDAAVSPVAHGIQSAYQKYNYAFKSVPYPFSVGVFALGGAVITYTTLHATKYLLDAGAGQISDHAPKKDIMSLEGAYQFAAPKLSKVALFKPMIITFKTSKEGFFESDLYNKNLKPAYLEIVDPIVQEAKEILHDVDSRVDEIAPIWEQTTNTVNSIVFPTEEQKQESRKERAKAIENIKWSATRIVTPAALISAPALMYVDRSLSIPFALAVTTGISVVQSRRWHNNNVQSDIEAKVEDKFAAAANDNPNIGNDNEPSAEKPRQEEERTYQGPNLPG